MKVNNVNLKLTLIRYSIFLQFNGLLFPDQRCAGRNYNGRRCCTPEAPCEYGEGDCDGPGDGGRHDGHAGCRGELVCGCGVTVMTSAVQCEGPGHWLEMSPVKLISSLTQDI